MAKVEDTIKASFGIFSDAVSPAVITEKLGMQPDEQWLKGAVIRDDLERKTNYWAITAACAEPADILCQVDHIVARLVPVKERLLGLSAECHFELSCTISVCVGPAAPGIHFGIDVLRFLTEVGVEIDIAVHCLTQH